MIRVLGSLSVIASHNYFFVRMDHNDGYAHGNYITPEQYRIICNVRNKQGVDAAKLTVGSMIRSLNGKKWYEVTDGLPIDNDVRG